MMTVPLKAAIEDWLETLGLKAVEASFWTPEEFFGEELDEYAERPLLVMTFDGDLHDILWSPVDGDSEASRRRREFEAIVKAQGLSIHRKNAATSYFTARPAAEP